MRAPYVFDPQNPHIVPDLLLPALSAHGVKKEEVLALLCVDLDDDCLFKDCYLIATKERLLYIAGVTRLCREDKKTLQVFVPCKQTEWQMKDLSEMKMEDLVSSCRLTAVCQNERFVLCNFSLSFKEDVRIFRGYLEEIAKTGSFTPLSGEKAKKKELYCPKCGLRYADAENKVCPRCQKQSKTVWRTAKLLSGYKWKLILIGLTLILSGALSVVAPYFSAGFFYDELLDAAGAFYGKILLVIGIIVTTRLLSQLVSSIHSALTSVIAADMVYDLRKIIFSSINRLSLSFFTSRKTGGLMTQVNSDAQTIYWFFCDLIPSFTVNMVQVVAAILIMFLLSPPLCLAAILFIPPSIVAIRAIFKKMDVLHSRRFGRSRSLSSALSDMLGGVRVVKAFSGEQKEQKRFNKKNEELARADLNTNLYGAKAFPGVELLLRLGNSLVWAVGGVMILLHLTNPALVGERQVLTYGLLATFLSYVSMIYSPLFGFVDMISQAADSIKAMSRLFEIMDARPDVVERSDPLRLEEVKGGLRFENTGFCYIPGQTVLEKISFEVEAGKTVGIVGKTGAGKSTLAHLILRLYDPTEGDIYLDGVNLKDLSFEDLRKNVAIVSQDTYLFAGTILENVRYARPDATLMEVFEACVASGAHEFIMKLRDGYETRIGQGNADLSGGERQRLSIARAILKDPKILIHDEATAAMDTRTEMIIQRSLTALSRGRTTLIIAHRLSTLRDADELIVIDGKTVAERGTPAELIRQKGIYYTLYKMQTEALKTIGIAED